MGAIFCFRFFILFSIEVFLFKQIRALKMNNVMDKAQLARKQSKKVTEKNYERKNVN